MKAKRAIVIGLIVCVLIIFGLIISIDHKDNVHISNMELTNIFQQMDESESIDIKVDGKDCEVEDIKQVIEILNNNNWESIQTDGNALSIFAPYMMIEYDIDSKQTHIYIDKNSNLVEIRYGESIEYYKIDDDVIESLDKYIENFND